MAGNKKTTKVGSIYHRGANIRIDLNVDRDTKLFWADALGTRIEHAEGKEVERLALEAIDTAMDVEWIPVIGVSPWQANGMEHTVFGFYADRLYIANLPNHVGLRQTQWNAKDNNQRLAWSRAFSWRPELGEFKPPCVFRGYSDSAIYYLPYSDDVWDRLVFLRDQINSLKNGFAAVLSSPDVATELAAFDLRAS